MQLPALMQSQPQPIGTTPQTLGMLGTHLDTLMLEQY
jgi:hypothetical protein